MKKPNILLYFTDQQRADTLGCYGQTLPISPVLDGLARDGVLFENAFTPQPVCGPCRAVFQTGLYPTRTGVYRNNRALPLDARTTARAFTAHGYETAYVGKWHLASEGALESTPAMDYHTVAIPPERRGGYEGFWRAADVLEFTSHGYDGYVFDEHMQRVDFTGYRADCITDFGLEFLDGYNGEKPFFLTISHIEPHHQNDRNHYEGPDGSKERFRDFQLPDDLAALGGDAREEYPDYLGQCRSLDDNLGRLVKKLKEKGLYGSTLIAFVSDHGSHFRTRNQDAHKNGYDDYKRSCHTACLRVPLVLHGPGFLGGKRVKRLVSTVSLSKTLLTAAGMDAGWMDGEDLQRVAKGDMDGQSEVVFAQISESRVGRCVRTPDFLYAAYAPGKHGGEHMDSDEYADDFLYDLQKDPAELNNVVADPAYRDTLLKMRAELLRQLNKAGERPARIVTP